jgi:hypothetical protein
VRSGTHGEQKRRVSQADFDKFKTEDFMKKQTLKILIVVSVLGLLMSASFSQARNVRS